MRYDNRLAIGVWARGMLYLWCVIEVGLFVLVSQELGTPTLAGPAAVAVLVALGWGVATAIFVWIWIYRAMAIAHELMPSLTISPGWAVGWYFVPVAALWKPYEAMREISDGTQSGHEWDETSGSLIGWWWAMWLVRTVTNLLMGMLGTTMILVSAVAGIAAAVLLAEIIRRITARVAHSVDASIFA